ncbi:ATP-binding protein [Pseudomonas fluorescens]|uniref:ATP-binding protein n=1 Tax=Pseudomonas fluorescens TaxID=294 RepID=UPI001911E95F|nr:ATP-binding protein [Pseudomonas fluorescens]
MREIEHPPHAASLLESMRSIGYTLESALADILDNSLSANAKNIDIEFRPYDEPYIAIIDDGHGMSSVILERAMRHGSTNPLDLRAADDMGRYGLGLKTSSLSQCRRMTVISKQNFVITGLCWDLDVVIDRQSWIMLELDNEDLANIPHIEELSKRSSGTLVLWQKLDKLIAGEVSVEAALVGKMAHVYDHLSLVFHRFLKKEDRHPKIDISLNGKKLPPVDPFLTEHQATQKLEQDSFFIDGEKVVVKPFIIPHMSKLSVEQIETAGGAEGIRNHQGFYVYRNRRLIIWGTWFRLAGKDELSKLARVRVDIPNSLDHLWTLDIKKSAAHPPEVVRKNLKRTIERIRMVSGRTIKFRGRISEKIDFTPAWNEVVDRGGVRFDINRDHPLIKGFQSELPDKLAGSSFEIILKIIESSFPADALYSRMASDIKSGFNGDYLEKQLREMAITLFDGIAHDSPTRIHLLSTLHVIEPFNIYPELTKKIVEELERLEQ